MAQRVFTREDAKGLIRTNSEKVTLPFDFTERCACRLFTGEITCDT